YRERHWAGFRAAVARGATKLDQPAANIPIVCRDRSVVRFPGRLVLLRDARNHVVGVMGIFAPNDGSETGLVRGLQALVGLQEGL
ncbi:MAG: hypothetical protein Q8S13_06835, partial [Dehalococcoidia bacterium]|nr:hypothetical protein [Dehalococcoidia bacterium]